MLREALRKVRFMNNMILIIMLKAPDEKVCNLIMVEFKFK